MDSPFSDASSELSMLSRSPSPPSSSPRRRLSWFNTVMCLPSPPGSQDSSRQTPCLDDTSSGTASSVEDGDERPTKRRRVSSIMSRDTRRLNLTKLRDLESQAELDRLIKAIRTKRKIVVIAGAGISVSAGIPDFRSSDGLFKSLKSQHNLKGSGKQLFDAAVYRDSDSTSSFHQMVRQLSTETKIAKPTRFHHLLASLAQQGRLLRLYTQNVDGIDTALPPLATQVPVPRKAPWPKTIQLHGGLSKMVCTKCGSIDDFEPELFDGPIPPECKACLEMDDVRDAAGKRSHGVGKLRPRMVLYNEGNPDDEAIGSCVKSDLRRRPDCIIVVGTTLKVPGIRRIVREMTGVVKGHRDGVSVWINNDPEPAGKDFENSWDIVVKGTSDQVAEHADLRQWDHDEVGDVKLVSEEEVRHIKNHNGLKVIVQSPSKPPKFLDAGSIPTPVDSPRPGHVLPSDSVLEANGSSVRKLTLTYSRPVSVPASRGRKLDDLLGPIVLSRAPKLKRVAPDDATSTVKGKRRCPIASKRGLKTGQLAYAPTKGNPNNAPVESKKERLEPLTASPTRENMPFPPRAFSDGKKVPEAEP